MTFSVVAFDPEERKWGVGVASRFLSVGSVVPWAVAGVGCIATQSYANYSYGPRGLDLLRGKSASEVVKELTESDPLREKRQLAVVDSRGGVAAFTGKSCHDYAGHITGKHFSVQGNILAGEAVLTSMASAMEENAPLEDRIMKALFGAESMGGDRRGKQSAALLVVCESRGFEEGSDRYIDLRVEDARTPLNDLNRLVGLWKATFLDNDAVDVSIHEKEIANRLRHIGYRSLEEWLRDNSLENSFNEGKLGLVAMRILMGNENPELPKIQKNGK